jgi:hypothetical protein
MYSPPPGARTAAPPAASSSQAADDLFMLEDDESDVIPISALIAAISAESAGGPLPPAIPVSPGPSLRERLRQIEAQIRQHWMALRTLVREHEVLRGDHGRAAGAAVGIGAIPVAEAPPDDLAAAATSVTPVSGLGSALASLSRPQKTKSFLPPRYRTAAE